MMLVQTDSFILGPNEMLSSELALVANRIVLDGRAADDVFVMGAPASMWREDPKDGSIMLAGTFDNDVWALGKRVTLTGAIRDHARFAGQTVAIHGSVGKASVFLGNTVHLSRSADVAADAVLMGEDVIAEGWVEGDLTLVGKNVTLAGTVGGDVNITAQDVVALPGADIMGNVIYRCPREFVPDSRVVIRGKIIRAPMPQRQAEFSREALAYQLWLWLGALAVGMVVLAAFPSVAGRGVEHLRHALWRCLATGGMVLCLSPVALAAAFLSLIGIPLGLLCAAGLAILVYLSKITVAISLGGWLLRQSQPRAYPQLLLPLAVGLLFIYTGVHGGVFGMVVWFLVTSAGLGSLILAFIPARRPGPPPVPAGAPTPPAAM